MLASAGPKGEPKNLLSKMKDDSVVASLSNSYKSFLLNLPV